MHHPLPHCALIHCLVSINVQQGQWGQFFSTVPYHCFICTSMSDTILSDCPSAAIRHTATKCNGILVGRFNLYCHSTTTYHLTVHTATIWSPYKHSARTDFFFFSHVEEFSDTPLLHMHFSVRCHFVKLPLCCHLSHSNKM